MLDNQPKPSSAVREDGSYGSSKNSSLLLSYLYGIWYNRNMKHIPLEFIDKLDEDKRTETRQNIRFGSPNERFWAKVDKSGDCLVWRGAASKGYGLFAIKRHSDIYAHRYSYESLMGRIEDGLQLDHSCKNTRCVNPEHLEPVTAKENIMRSGGLASVNARKTSCKYGHSLEDAYIFKDRVDKNGNQKFKRACRTCWPLRTNRGMKPADLEKMYATV